MRPSPLRHVENAKSYESNPTIAITAVDLLTKMQNGSIIDIIDYIHEVGYPDFANELRTVVTDEKSMKFYAKKKSYESRDNTMCRLNYLWLPSGRACIHCGDKIELKSISCEMCKKVQ